MTKLPSAIFLLGPTGAGKTPLGQYLQSHGLAGRRCVHFDFGAHLRAAADTPHHYLRLTADDLAVIRRVLQTGALLEDHGFPIAEKILRSAIASAKMKDDDWLILNGLPRHIGQADAVARLVNVQAVVLLDCDADIVFRRIRDNTGGDRIDRTDDDLPAVERKLHLFNQRTAPLVDYYRTCGAAIHRVPIGPHTTPAQIALLVGEGLP